MSVAAEAWDDADADLVSALRRDDGDAAGQLVERYGERVYRLAMRVTGESHDAEAVALETLATAVDDIQTFTGESTLAGWIDRLAAAAAYRKLRAREPRVDEIAPAEVLPPLDADGHFVLIDDWSKREADAAVQAEVRQVLSAMIGALPVADRVAFVLSDVEGMSSADIAEVLETGVRRVVSRVHRARLFLRRHLSEHFESVSDRRGLESTAADGASRPAH